MEVHSMKPLIFLSTALAASMFALPAIARNPAPGPASTGKGWFHADCDFNRRAKDDPIVFFRGAGMAHSHDFLGAAVKAESTNDSIRRGSTSCVRTDTPSHDSDRSGYWFPTLFVNDK